jgi:hypothetical protein
VLALIFVLGGYGYNQINNFRHFMAMILSVAAIVMLSQQPPLTMSFIKESFKFFCKFCKLGTGCLSLLGGFCLNIQVMPWVWFRNDHWSNRN